MTAHIHVEAQRSIPYSMSYRPCHCKNMTWRWDMPVIF